MGLIDRLSLRDTISLAVAATIAAVALPAVAIHTYVSRRSIGHHTTQQLAPIANLLAAQAAPLISPDQRQRLDQWTAAAAHADVVLALAVFDADGRLASLHADRAELVNLLATAGAAQNQIVKSVILPAPAQHLSPADTPAWLALIPIPTDQPGEHSGHLAALLKSPAGPTVPPWLFSAVIVVMAGLVGFATGGWLVRRVAEPLEELVDSWQLQKTDHLPKWLDQRGDAVGRLARLLFSLRRQAQDWHHKAQQLQLTVDQRVAAQTRQISLAQQRAELLAQRDPLTDLSSRRFIDEKLPELFDIQHQAGRDLSLIMIDLNDFKQFNDTYGHQLGDQLLRLTGSLLRQSLRQGDIAARYGGDEFLVILPDVSARQASSIANRTAAMFDQQAKTLPTPERRASLSAGVASIRHNRPTNLAQLIRLADQALYQAKQSRYSVHLAPDQAQNQPALQPL